MCALKWKYRISSIAGMLLCMGWCEANSLLVNGDFALAAPVHHQAPAGWSVNATNHRVLGGQSSDAGALRLQKIWPASTVPVVYQDFRVPEDATELRLSLTAVVSEGNRALVRLRNLSGAHGAGSFYNGAEWEEFLPVPSYGDFPEANAYALGDLWKMDELHSFAVSSTTKSEHQFVVVLPKVDSEVYRLELSVSGQATGEAEDAVAVEFSNMELSAWDQHGRELTSNRVGGALDADAILSRPPASNVRLRHDNGVPEVWIDEQNCTLLGWAPMVNRNVGDAEIAMMVGESNLPVSRLVFGLGESMYGLPYPISWQGPNLYDWSELDIQLERLVRPNPNNKVILHVALDGASWWSKLYPEDSTRDGALPDYLSERWLQDCRELIRQMIAHIQSGPYADTVIGYTLFNGGTLDCNWVPDIQTPAALREFRRFLTERYASDAALQAAWSDDQVTLANALPNLDYDAAIEQYPLIFVPAKHRQVADSVEFYDWAQNSFMHYFAKTVKEATHHRRLVGVRTGNLLYGSWSHHFAGYGRNGQWGGDRSFSLLDDPGVDYLEQWDQYPGRGLGEWGCMSPVNPVRGILEKGKLMILQDDVRTHVGADKGFGATKNLAETLAKQKMVFLNAITQGMTPYLWQQSYTFAIPEMMDFWRKVQEIFAKNLKLKRQSVAEIAFVMDADMQRFVGMDLEIAEPTRGFALLEYPRFQWARGGGGYDMIFLDQMPQSSYKVYVFFHTFQLGEAAIRMIQEVLKRNQAVGIFVWNDGILDGGENFSVANTELLTGMKLQIHSKDLSWQMQPTSYLLEAGFPRHRKLGLLDTPEPCEPEEAELRVYPPTLVVVDPAATALASSVQDPKAVVVAEKQQDGWLSIYSQSPILAPGILRYALKRAGGFSYLDGDDALFVNSDFLGVHTRSDSQEITLRLPQRGVLFDLFSEQEYEVDGSLTLPVEPNQTYWFFRGSAAQWQAIGKDIE